MTEQRALRTFRGFDLPVDPDPGFAAALYDELAAELGFQASTRAPQPVSPAVGPAARPAGRPGLRPPAWAARLGVGARAWRLAYVAAIVGLLVLLGLAAIAVGTLISRPDPFGLVERSRAVYQAPPAFTMTFTDPQGQRWQLAADGAGTWRTEGGDQQPGAYTLYDGERIATYDPTMQTWGVSPAVDWGGPPYPLYNEFAWTRPVPDSNPIAFETVPCTQATLVAREEVASRPADHVRCPDSDIDYWLDTGTGLVLRMEAGPTARGWEGPTTGLVPVMEAVSFEAAEADPTRFSWDGPEGAYPASDPPTSTVLKVGEAAPLLAGTTVDGRPFTTAPGQPTAVLFTFRGGGMATRAAFDAAASGTDGVRAIVVQANPAGTVAGYLDGHPTSAAVVADPGQALSDTWGIHFSLAMVLLDAQGRVAAITRQSMTEGDARAQLEALRDGRTVPELPPPPEGTPWPEPSERIEGSSGGLGRWDSPEPWSAPLLGGGTIAAADLRGRPAFVWFWSSESEPTTSSLLDFAALAKAYGDRAAFLVVAMGEPEPGWVAGTVEQAGIDVPVAFDWDGAVDTAFRIGTESTYLLDGEGRVADTVDGVPAEAAAGRMLDALPAPAISP